MAAGVAQDRSLVPLDFERVHIGHQSQMITLCPQGGPDSSPGKTLLEGDAGPLQIVSDDGGGLKLLEAPFGMIKEGLPQLKDLVAGRLQEAKGLLSIRTHVYQPKPVC